jgi:hypothetical protein
MAMYKAKELGKNRVISIFIIDDKKWKKR